MDQRDRRFVHDLHEGDELITLSAVRLIEVPDLVDTYTEMVKVILGDDDFSVVQESAAAVLQRLEDAVIYKKNSARRQDAGGESLSIGLSWIRIL